jgi:hypothetical protein
MARSSRSASTTPTAPFTAPRARVPSHSGGTRIAKTTVHPTATIGTAHHLRHKPSTGPATIAVGITACVSHGPTADRQIWRDQRWWSDDGGDHQRVRTGGCMQTRVVSGWIVDLGIPTGSSDRDLRDRDGPFGALTRQAPSTMSNRYVSRVPHNPPHHSDTETRALPALLVGSHSTTASAERPTSSSCRGALLPAPPGNARPDAVWPRSNPVSPGGCAPHTVCRTAPTAPACSGPTECRNGPLPPGRRGRRRVAATPPARTSAPSG